MQGSGIGPANIGAAGPSKPHMTDQTDERRARRMARKNAATFIALLRLGADALDVAAHECADDMGAVPLDGLPSRIEALRVSIPGQSEGFYVLKALVDALRSSADAGSDELRRQGVAVLLRRGIVDDSDPENPVLYSRAPLRVVEDPEA